MRLNRVQYAGVLAQVIGRFRASGRRGDPSFIVWKIASRFLGSGLLRHGGYRRRIALILNVVVNVIVGQFNVLVILLIGLNDLNDPKFELIGGFGSHGRVSDPYPRRD